MLGELNRTGRRKIPPDAPLGFVPRAWLPFVVSGEDKVSRRFWELALLWRLGTWRWALIDAVVQ